MYNNEDINPNKEEEEEEVAPPTNLYDQVDIKLIDFGGACYSDSYEDTTEIDTGTFIFFPPEVLNHGELEKEPFSFPRDVWAAGVTLLSIVCVFFLKLSFWQQKRINVFNRCMQLMNHCFHMIKTTMIMKSCISVLRHSCKVYQISVVN